MSSLAAHTFGDQDEFIVSEECINIFPVLSKIDFRRISTKGEVVKIDFSLISAKGNIVKIFLVSIIIAIPLLLTIYIFPLIVSYLESLDHAANNEGHLRIRYAYETINIRAGRSTDHEVIGKLYRGNVVVVDSLKDGWVKVYRTGVSRGYVFYELLKEEPLPKFEIASWDWQKQPDSLVVSFNFTVRNNTLFPKNQVTVEFTTFDASGEIIETERTPVTDLPPGGTASGKGYVKYFGTEEEAVVSLVE